MRNLVSVRKIDRLLPIDGADRIELAVVDGWKVVVQKGIHKEGDAIVYFEVDCFLPESDKRFESFMKFGTRTFNNVVGHRVKTVKLRGQISQGVIIPLSEFPEIELDFDEGYNENDYAPKIGVAKWERPDVCSSSTRNAKGNFPWFIPKTDQERIQNIYNKRHVRELEDEEFVGTLKLDGSSCTVFYVNDEKYSTQGYGLCSRNIELKLAEKQEETSNFEYGAIASDLFAKVLAMHDITGNFYAIQGELVGQGVQGNYEKFNTYKVFAFAIYDITEQRYLTQAEFTVYTRFLGIETVPVIYEKQCVLKNPLDTILDYAEGKSINNNVREGIVWKQWGGTFSFKAISNKYLLGEKDE